MTETMWIIGALMGVAVLVLVCTLLMMLSRRSDRAWERYFEARRQEAEADLSWRRSVEARLAKLDQSDAPSE